MILFLVTEEKLLVFLLRVMNLLEFAEIHRVMLFLASGTTSACPNQLAIHIHNSSLKVDAPQVPPDEWTRMPIVL
jgi:hypothetical protein